MSDVLAIQWERKRLCVLDAHAQRGGVRIRRGLVLEWPPGGLPDLPKVAGEWLGAELRKAGLEGRRAHVVLPREDCVIRRIDLPSAPDEELPDLVRMQAATVSSTPVERLALDFVPLPTASDASGRVVLMATIFRDRLESIRAVLAQAGVELESVSLAALGIAETAARAEQRRGLPRDQASLVVAWHDGRVEMTAARDGRLIMAHATDLAGETATQDQVRFLAELGRSLVALEALGGQGVARAWTIGAPPGLKEAIVERFGFSVEEFDPLTDSGAITVAEPPRGTRSDYAAPAGALLALSGRMLEPIDFLSPRRPPEKKDRRRQRLALAAGAAAIVAAAGFWMLHAERSDLDAKIAGLRAEQAKLDETIKASQPLLASAKTLADWTDRRVDWLGQLRQVGETLPGTHRIYLTDLRATLSTNDAIARLRATGFARDRRDVEILSQRMRDENYRVRPQEIRYSDFDADHPWRFEADLDLLMPAKSGTAGTPSVATSTAVRAAGAESAK